MFEAFASLLGLPFETQFRLRIPFIGFISSPLQSLRSTICVRRASVSSRLIDDPLICAELSHV